jgi:CheY-like chemotaxis protein
MQLDGSNPVRSHGSQEPVKQHPLSETLRQALLAVDQEAVRRMVHASLEQARWTLRDAIGERQAAELLLSHSPDVVITDVGTGAAAGFIPWTHARFPKLPIVVLTEPSEVEVAGRCLRQGASTLLGKSSISFGLRRVLEHLIDRTPIPVDRLNSEVLGRRFWRRFVPDCPFAILRRRDGVRLWARVSDVSFGGIQLAVVVGAPLQVDQTTEVEFDGAVMRAVVRHIAPCEDGFVRLGLEWC